MNASKLTTTIVTSAVMALGGLVGNIASSHAAPSPSKGVVCPAGFNGNSPNPNQLRCVRRVEVLIENVCPDSRFPKLTLRVGRDICTRNDVNPPSSGPLTGFTKGRDYVDSIPNTAARARAEQLLEQGFASGKVPLPKLSVNRIPTVLPVIPAAEREAVFVGQELKLDDNGTLDDHTLVKFDVFVFPVKKQ